eukprot:Hpha_TRINITY_DN8589_c0_g1::TRINITY_DN8589_c0_g1_i1::g.146383::m.146383
MTATEVTIKRELCAPVHTVPQRPALAVGVGFLIGLSCTALVFNYNLPGSLETGLEDDKGFSSGEVTILLFVYSIPNTLLSLFAGELIDRVGLTKVAAGCMFLIASASVLGALSLHLSDSHNSQYHIMLAGRLLLGFGDCLGLTCMPAFIARWFRHNHNGLAMGIGLMVIQTFGGAMSFFFPPIIREKATIEWAMWSGAFVAGGSCLAFVGYAAAEASYSEYIAGMVVFDEVQADFLPDTRAGTRETAGLQDDRVSVVSGNASSIAGSARGAAFLPEVKRVEVTGEPAPEVRSMCQKLRAFSAAFWLQNLAIFFTPVCQYISLNYMHYYLENERNFSSTTAGVCASVVYFCCVAAPMWGAACDRFGGRVYVQLVLAVVAAAVFLLLRFTNISPWPLVGVLGVCFAGLEQNCYAVLDHLMPPDLVGFGYGVMGFVYNIGLGVLPLLTRFVHSQSGGYNDQNILFAGWLGAGVLCTIALLFAVDPHQAKESGLFWRGGAEDEYVRVPTEEPPAHSTS